MRLNAPAVRLLLTQEDSLVASEEKAVSQIAAALAAEIGPATEAIRGELDALRVAFDVRCESVIETVAKLRSASPGWLQDVTRKLAQAAAEEVDAAARVARSEAVAQGLACLEFERARAKERLEAVERESAAQREANQRERAALQEALAEARAQLEALRTETRAQLEAAKAERLQVLEQSRARMDGAREDAERAATAHGKVVDDLRTQVEQARADLQRVLADADLKRVTPARREDQADLPAPEISTQATTAEKRGGVAAQLDVPAESRREELQPAGDPQTHPPVVHQTEREPSPSDPLSPMFHVLDEAATATQALDALLDAVGAVNARAALFLVKSDKLQGWRSVGFESQAAITPKFELPLTVDSVLTRAATSKQTVVAGGRPASEAGPAGAAHELWAVAVPVTLGDRVVAIVYADEGAQVGSKRPESDRASAVDVNERLARHAGQRLAVITATNRGGDGTFNPEVPTSSEKPASSPERLRSAERIDIDDAQRYATLLVSEMKRYYEADLSAGSPDAHLSTRLRDEIERCRRLYAKRVPVEARGTENLLEEAILKMFGGACAEVRNVSPALVGPSEP